MGNIKSAFMCKSQPKCDPFNYFKGARSYFLKFSSLFHLKNHHSKGVNLKFQLKRSSRLDERSNFVYLMLPISYCISIIIITITWQVFINIFQTEHFSAVKSAMR